MDLIKSPATMRALRDLVLEALEGSTRLVISTMDVLRIVAKKIRAMFRIDAVRTLGLVRVKGILHHVKQQDSQVMRIDVEAEAPVAIKSIATGARVANKIVDKTADQVMRLKRILTPRGRRNHDYFVA